MIEHRLIERMIEMMRAELANIQETNQVDSLFISMAVDFIRVYADQTHHGKEEDILFRDLEAKRSTLTQEHQRTMDELIQEHIYGRGEVKALVTFNQRIIDGDQDAVEGITTHLKNLVDFYPKHIEKEDKHFFIPCMDYFSKKKQQEMLEEFWEFDRKMIHEKYKAVVNAWEKNRERSLLAEARQA
jgi:hemerythrin-like domain-containing protein